MAATTVEFGISAPDENEGPEMLQVMWILTAISSIVVILRIYTKLYRTRRIYWDDGLMVFALILGYIYAGILTWAIHYGMGRHMLDLTTDNRNHALRSGIISLGWGILAPMVARVSFCVTLLYLAGTDTNVKKWPIWIFIVVQLVSNIASVIAFYAQCGSNLDIYWTPSKIAMMKTACWNPAVQTKLGYFAGSINCVTDAFLTVLPAVLIEHTKLSWKRKIGLACLMCLSAIALVASIVKTYAVKALSQVSDYTYDLAYYVIWISVELNIVITVTSIPLIRPLFQRRKAIVSEPETNPAKWDTMTLSSAFSKGARSRAAQMSVSSQENIVPHPPEKYEMDDGGGITVTREVSVTYQPSNAPFVHAALVGLVQGEIGNPHLAHEQ